MMSYRHTTLGQVADINPKADWTSVNQLPVVSFVPMAAVSDSNYCLMGVQERPLEAVRKGFTYFRRGDVLLAKITPCFENGKVALAEIPQEHGFGSTEFHVIRAKEGTTHPRFLYYMLRRPAFLSEGTRNMTGSAGQKRVPKLFLENLSLALPSLEQQEWIVEALDKADALRRKDQELLQKYDELAQSIFYEMFGDPLGSSDNRVPLSSVVEINPSKREARVSPDTPVSFLPMTCVGEDGSLELSQVRQFKEVSTGFTYFRDDDVLFAKITPCMENGKGAIARGLLNGIGFGSTEFHVLRPSTRTTSEFIYTLLHLTDVRKEAANNMTGSGGQQRVPRTFFDALCITVPPVELQEDFSKRLSVVRALRARALSNIASSTTLFDSLLSKYFV